MVKDFRKITLNKNELIHALESYRRVTPTFLPGGKIIDCIELDENTLGVNVTLTYNGTSQSSDFQFSPPDLIQPLIRFCCENNIVLPKEGRLSVSFNSGVSLCVMLRNDPPEAGNE